MIHTSQNQQEKAWTEILKEILEPVKINSW